ncbi:MAG: PEGA domain-containing protein [Prevotella sp.]|nr:PEGA domain-containing protein [Prevotella sp.]
MKTLIYKIFVLSIVFVLSHEAKAQKAITLPIDYVKISLQSYPEGAKVYHNGKLICTSTPATVEIPYRGLIVPGSKKDLQ